MYGDCQVLSSSINGGNGVPSDAFYSSPIQNPSFNFMPTLPFDIFPPILPKEENGILEMESGSAGSEPFEGFSGNEIEAAGEQQQQPPPKKKRFHRHTAVQIQEMEALFKENPHPDDKQRLKLSQDLGLKPRQVKFWFQNRRTQMKAQQDRSDNVVLRAENENLKNDNYRLQAVLRNIICSHCGGPGMLGEMGYDEHQLRLENARLKEEFERMCCLVSQFSGRPMQSLAVDLDMSMFPRKYEETMGSDMLIPMPFMPENPPFPGGGSGGGRLILEEEKSVAMEMALSSMDELVKMCQMGEPLWTSRANDDQTGNKEVLNGKEYERMFPWRPLMVGGIKQPSEFRTEATTDSAVVIMSSLILVDAFLDADKWMELFPSIISRAKTLQVVASGVSGQASGSLHLMYAELQVASPLVPTRETHFLRYCQHNKEEGSWVVVDFPVENFHNSCPLSYPYYRRRPSGCIIQDMPNGYSRVTWVEHAEIEENPVHQIFNHFMSSGMAFGARRWLAVLQRQCERLASLMARNIPDLGVIPSPEARKNLMNLAERMIRTFCVNISTACGQSWTALSDSADDTVRITTRRVAEPGQPNGLILTAVSTTWLPFSHDQVFDLLRDEQRRSQLDVLSIGNALQEVAHIANGSHPGNCISLLRINLASNSSQRLELMLQESCTDDSGSLVVYTTVDVDAIQLAMSSDDPSCIPILPVGFVIVPARQTNNHRNVTNDALSSQDGHVPAAGPGCLLTVGLQVLTSTIPTAKLSLSSVTAINHHLSSTIEQINAALGSGNDHRNGNCCSGNRGLVACSEEAAAAVPVKQTDQDALN